MKLGRLTKALKTGDPAATLPPWRTALQRAETLSPTELAKWHDTAHTLRRTLDQFDQKATTRIAATRPIAVDPDKARHLEWSGRPAPWAARCQPPGHVQPQNGTELGSGAKLFHDCPLSELSIRQQRNPSAPNLASFGIILDVMRFEGSYLSLALDLPDAALSGLTKDHVISVDFTLETDRPVGIYVRLNLRCGPNTVTMLQGLPGEGSSARVDFDLAYSDLDPDRLEAAWIDVMFERPALLGVALRDLTLMRCRRADL